MQQLIIDTNTLALPQEFVKKIGTEKVMIKAVGEGILLTPVTNPEKKLRGVLKGTGFSTDSYLKAKSAEKELEK